MLSSFSRRARLNGLGRTLYPNLFLIYFSSDPSTSKGILEKRSSLQTSKKKKEIDMVSKGQPKKLVKAKKPATKQSVTKEPIGVTGYANILYRLARNRNNLERVVQLQEEMKMKGIALNRKSYMAILRAYCSVGDSAKIEEIVGQANSEGIKPNKFTYNCLISSFVHNGDLRSAMNMIEKMKSAGMEPDVITYRFLIETAAKAKRLDEAKEFFAKSREVNNAVDIGCLYGLLDTYAEVCSMHSAQEYLIECQRLLSSIGDIPLDLEICSRLITICGIGELVDEGRKYLDEAKNILCKLKPGLGNAKAVVPAHALVRSLGQLDLTVDVTKSELHWIFKSIGVKGGKFKDKTFGEVINLFERKNQPMGAINFFEELLDVGYIKNKSLIHGAMMTCVEHLFLREKIDKWTAKDMMTEVIDGTKKRGQYLSLAGYKSWISLCKEMSDIDCVRRCWEDFKTTGKTPDYEIIRATLRIYLDNWMTVEAMELLSWSTTSKLRMRRMEAVMVLEHLVECKDEQRARELIGLMENAGIRSDEFVNNLLLKLGLN